MVFDSQSKLLPFFVNWSPTLISSSPDEFLLLLGPQGAKTARPRPRPTFVKEQQLKKRVDTEEKDEPDADDQRWTDKEWPRQWYLNRGGQLDMNVEAAWDRGYRWRLLCYHHNLSHHNCLSRNGATVAALNLDIQILNINIIISDILCVSLSLIIICIFLVFVQWKRCDCYNSGRWCGVEPPRSQPVS